jgi:hypothetical protein
LGATTSYGQTVLRVDADATDPVPDGTSWSKAYPHLQDALAVASGMASPGTPIQIRVAQGAYMPDGGRIGDAGYVTGSAVRSTSFQLVNDVTIEGGYAGLGEADPDDRDVVGHETILSGDLGGDDLPAFVNNGENSYHVMTGSVNDASAVVDGFTITGGHANGSAPDNRGGGIHLDSSHPTVTNCAFMANAAVVGGGMYNQSSNPTVTDGTFSGNTASGSGGGMFNNLSAPVVARCTFINNISGGDGGGMHNAGSLSDPMVFHCAFIGNTAGEGGGMYNAASSGPTVVNGLFSGNAVPTNGGAMAVVQGSSAVVENCVLWGNTANAVQGGGGGVRIAVDSSVAMTNCILWGNAAPVGDGDEILNIGTSTTIRYCDIQGCGGSGAGWDLALGIDGGGNVDADPLFVDAPGTDGTPGTQDDNLRLQAGSPCIDAGDSTAVPADVLDLDGDGDTSEPIPTDLAGAARLIDDPTTTDTGNPLGSGPIVDMGAFEVGPTAAWVPVLADSRMVVLSLLLLAVAIGTIRKRLYHCV